MKARWVVGASCLLYMLACSLTALQFTKDNQTLIEWPGGAVLAIGMLAPLVGCYAWYANPCLLAAWVLLATHRRRSTVFFASLALGLGLTTFSIVGREFPADEADVSHMTLTQVREGTYLWLGSIMMILLGALLVRNSPSLAVKSEHAVPLTLPESDG